MGEVCYSYGGSVGHFAWLLHLYASMLPSHMTLTPHLNHFFFLQIQNGRFKTGMCPYLSKPGGCPKGERCTYAHSEEERDRFRNLVKPGKPAKPRTGDQFSRAGVGGRRSGDHGPIKALTDSHTPSLNSYEVLPGTNGQHYTDLIRYSGMWVWWMVTLHMPIVVWSRSVHVLITSLGVM